MGFYCFCYLKNNSVWLWGVLNSKRSSYFRDPSRFPCLCVRSPWLPCLCSVCWKCELLLSSSLPGSTIPHRFPWPGCDKPLFVVPVCGTMCHKDPVCLPESAHNRHASQPRLYLHVAWWGGMQVASWASHWDSCAVSLNKRSPGNCMDPSWLTSDPTQKARQANRKSGPFWIQLSSTAKSPWLVT